MNKKLCDLDLKQFKFDFDSCDLSMLECLRYFINPENLGLVEYLYEENIVD